MSIDEAKARLREWAQQERAFIRGDGQKMINDLLDDHDPRRPRRRLQ